MPVFGIDLPRHFVVQFDDGNYSTFIDPFHGGKAITARECFALAEARVADPALLRRTSNKRIALRMLRNLHNVYLRRKDLEKALTTLDLMLEGTPEVSAWYKLRGALRLEMKQMRAAGDDLERYLAMEPAAPDREEVVGQLKHIHQWLGRVN